eukprot:12547549-Ditylum_brightwellii.AAC.1
MEQDKLSKKTRVYNNDKSDMDAFKDKGGNDNGLLGFDLTNLKAWHSHTKDFCCRSTKWQSMLFIN